MSNLVLDSLEIKNFRAFKHLRIEKLGRVNLIVGKNNVGKSSVLEALNIYLSSNPIETFRTLLVERKEMIREIVGTFVLGNYGNYAEEYGERNIAAYQRIFYGRTNNRNEVTRAAIGLINDIANTMSFSIAWRDVDNVLYAVPTDPVERANAISQGLFVPQKAPYFDVSSNGLAAAYRIDQPPHLYSIVTSPNRAQTSVLSVTAGGLTNQAIGLLWDGVTLSDLESDVIVALHIIAPDVKAVNLTGDGRFSSERLPKVRITNANGPVPLSSMGEGMNRMFGIALALVNAKDGMLLIDEVDTGLHYSVLPDLWKLIFEVAHRLNVQVFATTHSWDCIQAFQQATENNKDEEGVLVRLENRKAGVGAVTFDERELAIVTREQIEVR